MVSWLVGGLLIVGSAAQFLMRDDDRKARAYAWLFYASVVIVTGYAVYLTVAQYLIWKNSAGLGKFFVPPYQPLWYVVGYEFVRFGMYYATSLVVAFLLLIGAEYANQKFNSRFFEAGEPYLLALAVFLLGNPAWHYAWLWYIGAMLGVALLATIFKKLLVILRREPSRNNRFSLYRLWLPIALFVIIMETVL